MPFGLIILGSQRRLAPDAQGIACRLSPSVTFEGATVQSVVDLDATDDGFDGLAAHRHPGFHLLA